MSEIAGMPGRLGAAVKEDGSCRFTVWAPRTTTVAVLLEGPNGLTVPMTHVGDGYHTADVDSAGAGTRYHYEIDGRKRPDPASRSQPDGLHGPSEVVAGQFEWTDTDWRGLPLDSYIIYELHVGTFSPEGTFDTIIPRLDALAELGVTAIELMPVAQFPGSRDWGYDGAAPYAVQNSYGGPLGLKRLVDACHARGLAVVLDVVYNHLGPEGNYLSDFGPYFTDRYKTPWGTAVNFDGPDSDHVRRYFIENALMWIEDYHIDALRLDATHAYYDMSANPFIDILAAEVRRRKSELQRDVYLIAESDRSEDRLLRPVEVGGVGIDAQWSDELHHCLHTLLTGESFGYYQDFGQFSQLVDALRHGFVYSGQFSPFRRRRHGTFRRDLPAECFVVCSQNHDQVGNRMNGERLSRLVPFNALKLAAAVVLLSPYIPLLFMGEEYGETNPFLFFTSYDDPALQHAVGEGRKKEFEGYNWEGQAPDPQAEDTFAASKLDWSRREQHTHAGLLAYYSELIRLRKTVPSLRHLDKARMDVTGFERDRVVVMQRWSDDSRTCALFNFGTESATLTLPLPEGEWICALASDDPRWSGGGEAAPAHTPIASGAPARATVPPLSVLLYLKTIDQTNGKHRA